MANLLRVLDRAVELGSRRIAQHTSRRSLIVSMGKLLLGTAVALPVLPFDRLGRAYASGVRRKKKDPTETDCDYWRYCAIDGFLCSCCGGSATLCPPGTNPSKVSWVGTCTAATDGKQYIVSYTDCCGRTSCGKCLCNNNYGERPGYCMGVHNDVNWCMANESSVYHCTVSVILGAASS
jgi:amicyanin-dependent methylamine dehydrogenase small subunit